MSWIANRPIDDDERPGREIADGVRVERREVLRMSLGALAAFSLGWPQAALAKEPGMEKLEANAGDLAWDALLQLAVPLAEKIVKSRKPNETAYLQQLGALIARLKNVPAATFPEADGVRSHDHHRKHPFVVVQFRMAPGASIPFHDHRDYIGVLTAIRGEARVRSFDVVGDDPRPPVGKSFDIRETGDRRLTPGRLSPLTRSVDNIHDVRAGKEGARLLDFFTFFDAGGTSVYLDVAETPRDAEARVYEASWK